MGRYLLTRFIYLVSVFFIITIILFAIFKSTPGDPALMMVGSARAQVTPEVWDRIYANARVTLGLDDPLVIQYIRYLRNMVTFNFGFSIVNYRPVMDIARPALRLTAQLNLVIIFFTFLISIPLGITTAIRKGKAYDQIVQIITIIGFSLPSFIFAILAIFIFAIRLNWFPISGVSTPDFHGTAFEVVLDRLKYMAMPVIVMTFSNLAGVTRFVRASMIDALRMDYIRTARAKGLREKVVIYSHAFRNSLIPLVTIIVNSFIGIFAGAMIAESIFSYTGMGNLLLQSLQRADWAVSLAFTTFFMFISLIGFVIMDLMYLLVDPRVKLT